MVKGQDLPVQEKKELASKECSSFGCTTSCQADGSKDDGERYLQWIDNGNAEIRIARP